MRALLIAMSVLAPFALGACTHVDGESRFVLGLPSSNSESATTNAQSAAAVSAVAAPDSAGAVCPGKSTC